MPVKAISARALTGAYIVALLIIAGLSIASHAALEYSLQSNEGSAAIINKSGRQRMLSQRIASLAVQYRDGDAGVRGDLVSATNEFTAAHAFMIATFGEKAAARDARSRNLQALYFAPGRSLDAEVRRFVADARSMADLAPGDPALGPILSRILAAARAPLLEELDAVVTLEQRETERRIKNLEYLQWSILGVVLITLTLEALAIFRPMIRGITDYTAQLTLLATTDSLTGAANRRSFIERCAVEIAAARRHRRPASILMIDVDHFKSINDTHGHAAGDEVLAAVGVALREAVRQVDICGRLGGEEFGVLLVGTDLAGASVVAERIREGFAGMTISHGGKDIVFTVSIGCASLGEGDKRLEDILRSADRMMYKAKQSGRNRVVFEEAQGPDSGEAHVALS
jgi:diguanylate cyclase (GGDEF)-like protein